MALRSRASAAHLRLHDYRVRDLQDAEPDVAQLLVELLLDLVLPLFFGHFRFPFRWVSVAVRPRAYPPLERHYITVIRLRIASGNLKINNLFPLAMIAALRYNRNGCLIQ